MRKALLASLLICLSVMFAGCNRPNTDNLPINEKSDEKMDEKSDAKLSEKLDEMFADDYLEYPTVDKADDYMKECFEKVKGDWYDGDRSIGFYIDDDMYMMSGWSGRDRIIAYIEPVRKHENQFRIGLEAGEMQEILTCEIVEEDKEILINGITYVRKEK